MKVDLSAHEINLLLEALDSHAYWQVSEQHQRNNGNVHWNDEDENAAELNEIEKLSDKLQLCFSAAPKEGS